jgi:4-diphosphocytidyl-2-C-methyl-D-erythritol kinase
MLFAQHGRSLTVQTPAKLNLFLRIVARRPDGYHEIETVMVTVGLYDTLRFRDEPAGSTDPARPVSLRCFDAGSRWGRGPVPAGDVPTGPENLVVRAARLLNESTGGRHGAHVELFKRSPAAAGLAGGSSDAAATLVALDRLWDLRLSAGQLSELAARLGSDISFFLTRSPAALCRGRGEIVEPVRWSQPLHFVIVRPPSGLSTALVYQHCRPAGESPDAPRLVEALRRGRLHRAAQLLQNGLQTPAEELNEEVRHLRTLFAALPVLGHQMSGSGTAYFGLCATRQQALHVAGRLRAAHVGRVFVAQSRS